MKRVPLWVLCVLTITTSLALAEDRVAGAGILQFDEIPGYEGFTGHRVLTLNVRRAINGDVDGNIFILEKLEGFGYDFTIKDHISVDCMKIQGNVAYFSGILEKEVIEPCREWAGEPCTEENEPGAEGRPVVLSVQDMNLNADGTPNKRHNAPDMVGFLNFMPVHSEANCLCLPACNFLVELRDPTDRGDIQIRVAP